MRIALYSMKSKFSEMRFLSIGDMEKKTWDQSVNKMTSDPRLQLSCQNSLIFEKEKPRRLKKRAKILQLQKKRKEERTPIKNAQEGPE